MNGRLGQNSAHYRINEVLSTVLGRVVRKPINANPRLEVNQGFHLAR